MRAGYNHFISNRGEWNKCFSKLSKRVLPPIFISTILQSGFFFNLAHNFPYDVKLRLSAHSRSFLANQKARNAIVEAENLLIPISLYCADVIPISPLKATVLPISPHCCDAYPILLM